MLLQKKILPAIFGIIAFAAIPNIPWIANINALFPKYYIFFSPIVLMAGLAQVWRMRVDAISDHAPGRQLFALNFMFSNQRYSCLEQKRRAWPGR